jgi:hypothetical protein
LERDWAGFVWMNPPFGGRNGIRPWLDRFLSHGNGIALTPDRVSAPWFQEAWHRPTAILFTPKTPFLLPSGRTAGNPAFGNALWAVGERGVSALQRSAQMGFGRLCFPAIADRSPSGPRRTEDCGSVHESGGAGNGNRPSPIEDRKP